MSTRTPRANVSKFVDFDPTPEIFASDNNGAFVFPLRQKEEEAIACEGFDELRFVVSVWHPSGKHKIDLDRAYVELRAALDEQNPHWVRLAEIEPVVPPYDAGACFDGWIVLPVLGRSSLLRICGSGFEPRSRLQIRSSAYLVG